MFRLNSKIAIGDFQFTTVVDSEIQTSWDMFTDLSTIVMPTNLKNKSLSLIDNINRGDAVKMELGYFPTLVTEFEGYVFDVVPENPIKIKCQDSMYLLKQQRIRNYFKKNVTVKQLLEDLGLSDYNTVDANLGTIKINNANIVEVLETLKETYGLYPFYRDNVLNVGLVSNFDGITKVFYFNGDNANIITNSLKYQKSNSYILGIKGTSIKADNSRIELYASYDDNNKIVVSETETENTSRAFTYYDIDKAQLETNLRENLPKFIYTGYYGSFETFLAPSMQHGDKVTLRDLKYPERDGTYLIKSIVKKFGNNGGRQVIELDRRVS